MKINNVVIIGSGNRVQNTILPALYLVKDKFVIRDVYSKSTKNIRFQGSNTNIRTKTNIESIDFKDIDILIISITPSAVPEVLNMLPKKYLKNIFLYIDTPVVDYKDIKSTTFFKYFKKVAVLEDYISMFYFDKIAGFVRNKTFGNLKKIYLFHNGFRYHAIAILKKITGQLYIKKIKKKLISNGVSEITVSFWNGVECLILEPRKYEIGRFMVVFDRAIISDYGIFGQNSIQIHYSKSKELYYGYEFEGLINCKYNFINNEILINKHNNFRDISLINFMKIDSLAVMITNFKNYKYNYCYSQSLYDNMLTTILDKYGIVYDIPLPWIRYSFLSILISIKQLS